jgi:hypothetical protein
MLYGEEIRVVDSANADASLGAAVALETAAGAIASSLKTMDIPGFVRVIAYRPTVPFNYDTQTAEGVLTLYRYPKGVAANKVALGTIKLKDGAEAGKIHFAKIDNTPPLTVPPSQPPANYQAGDVLAVWITTQAAGGGGIAGDFQPLFYVSNRGENIPNQSMLVDLTE